MNPSCHRWIKDRRGIAAVEFTIVAPVLLLLLGGLADFGLLMSGKSQLANGVAQGAQYALLQGPSVSADTVRTAVKNGSSRSGLQSVVTATITGPACYCVSGQPAALTLSAAVLSATFTCGGACPSGAAPSAYLMITGSFVYQPLMPLYSQLSSTKVSETVTVRF